MIKNIPNLYNTILSIKNKNKQVQLEALFIYIEQTKF